MNPKTRSIIGWALTGVIVLAMVASASDKIIGSEHALGNTKVFGILPETYRLLGIIELLSILLFAVPRTGVLGLLLLSSYLGGGIATHLQHQQPFIFPSVIAAFVWITALIRFPEFLQRFKGIL